MSSTTAQKPWIFGDTVEDTIVYWRFWGLHPRISGVLLLLHYQFAICFLQLPPVCVTADGQMWYGGVRRPEAGQAAGFNVELLTVEVESRGLVDTLSLELN